MTKKKRILALAAAIVILMSCFVAAIVPASAAVNWYTCLYVGTGGSSSGGNEGNVPYPYTSWRSMLYDYYTYSGGTVYYFEVRNTELGGTRYDPTNVQWELAYGAYQTGWGDVDLVYRFYVPYFDADHGWDFQLRSSLGHIAVDSSILTLNRDPVNASIGYYEFTIDRNILGFDQGWYFYSNQEPPRPLMNNIQSYTVQFDYYFNDQVVTSRQTLVQASNSITSVLIPHIPDYIIRSASGNGYQSGNSFNFPSMYRDEIVRVDVISVDLALDQEYDQGFTEGRHEGYTSGYADGLQVGYNQGYSEGFEAGKNTGNDIPNFFGLFIEPVAQFLAIEPYPGLPIGIMFVAAVAISLIVIFLKIFAGG